VFQDIVVTFLGILGLQESALDARGAKRIVSLLMLEYSAFVVITSDSKPHPELHCDVEDGPYLYGERRKPCSLNDNCWVIRIGATYHHECADHKFGRNYVCECSECEPRYSFYFPPDRSVEPMAICPWCRKNCKNG
jgi:hypothetical protein